MVQEGDFLAVCRHTQRTVPVQMLDLRTVYYVYLELRYAQVLALELSETIFHVNYALKWLGSGTKSNARPL